MAISHLRWPHGGQLATYMRRRCRNDVKPVRSASGEECWFAATEEGALWMGTATPTALRPGGYQQLSGPIGAALNTRGDRLVVVADDLYQFVTG
jgi:hypothetical protein